MPVVPPMLAPTQPPSDEIFLTSSFTLLQDELERREEQQEQQAHQAREAQEEQEEHSQRGQQDQRQQQQQQHLQIEDRNHNVLLNDAARTLLQPPDERLANMNRFARCLESRFQRRKMTETDIDLRRLMPAGLGCQREDTVWEYTSCPICLVDFADGEELRRAPCPGGHAFHPKCLRGWLDRSQVTCPMCRCDMDSCRKPPPVGITPDQRAEYVMRRIKADLDIRSANCRLVDRVLRQIREPMPRTQEPPDPDVDGAQDWDEVPELIAPQPLSLEDAPSMAQRVTAQTGRLPHEAPSFSSRTSRSAASRLAASRPTNSRLTSSRLTAQPGRSPRRQT